MPNNGFGPSENTSNYTELREAASELSRYVSFITLDKLVGAAQTVANVTNPSLSRESDDIKKLELVVGSTEAAPLYDAAAKLLVNKQGSLVRHASFSTGGDPIFPKALPGTPTGNEGPINKRIISAFYHAASDKVDISSRLADISAMFCSIVPPLELSLCVPYFDVRIIYPKGSDGQGALSLLRYVGVRKGASDALMAGYQAVENDNVRIGYDVVGMEIFSIPQTLGPTTAQMNSTSEIFDRGVQILDPISPLLTLESANIQQTGIGGSLYAQTKVDLKLILHDRSRLSELEPIVTAEQFPSTTFRITYGWKHPHENKMVGNVYGKFINAMRVTQDFAVSSVSVASRDAASLALSLSLISMGNQVAKSAKILSGLGEYVPYSVLTPLVRQVVNFRASSKKTDITKFSSVGTTIVSSTNAAGSSNKFIRAQEFYKFRETVVEEMQKSQADNLKVSAIVDALNSVETNGVVEPDVSQYRELFKFTSGSYGDMLPDGFMPSIHAERMVKLAEENKCSGLNEKDRAAIVPLSAAVLRYVAGSLLTCQPDIDEVRLHTYGFNPACGEQASENIGNFPIVINDLQAIRDANSNKIVNSIDGRASIEKVLSLILTQVNRPASPFYGLTNDILKKAQAKKAAEDALGKPGITDAEREEINARLKAEIEKAKDEINNSNARILTQKKITALVDKAFVPPRVKSIIEVVPAYSDDSERATTPRRLARIHIYDERACGMNNKANFLASIMNSPAGIAIKSGTAAVPEEISEVITKITAASTALEREQDPDDGEYYAARSKKGLRDVIANAYPTIVIGSDTGFITNATYTSQPSGDVASAYLLTALEGGTTSDPTGASVTGDLVDDVNIIPTTVSITMLGNVCMTRGQTYFIDFNTGTTLDNTYTVTSVSHSIKPGGFTTTVSLAPVSSASMRSATRQLREIQKILDA